MNKLLVASLMFFACNSAYARALSVGMKCASVCAAVEQEVSTVKGTADYHRLASEYDVNLAKDAGPTPGGEVIIGMVEELGANEFNDQRVFAARGIWYQCGLHSPRANFVSQAASYPKFSYLVAISRLAAHLPAGSTFSCR